MIASNSSRGVARLGVVVPVSNTNLEPDMVMLRPDGVSLHFARAGGYDIDEVPDSEQMRKFADATLDEVVDGLKAALADMIVYGCTSATLSHGPAYDRAFVERIEARAGVPATTAASAVVEAARDLGVTKVGFCSPYTEQLNAEAAAFLGACGIEVVSDAYVGEDLGNYGQSALTPDDVLTLACRADSAGAEAIVLSCTDMRAVEAIDALEARLQKPVITSNQALVHTARKHLGLEGRVPGALGATATDKVRAAE
ncbi:MAG: aspartate/glutamate racemase family protein [Pseudomonadota bacterium]